ncbi:MAG TPA: RNA polymerase sigma factor [Saprospiraceae bacterium]|nr:RNA polymerase sigma factor [Saprospiraceae bacterium]HPI04782.1 RNA polymerase sigma factor [Saprospiraceae bacterium]
MKQTHLLPDPEGFALAKACHAGNRQAQYALWGRFKNRMFGVCQRFTVSRQEAEDLLQEAFVQVFRDIGRYRGEGSLEGWVRRIVLRTAIAHVQKQRLEMDMLNETELEQVLSVTDQAFGNPDSDEPGRLVTLLQKLPPGFRAVLNLYVIEERSHEEIARELGITVSTSKSQLNRAKAFLRGLVDKTLLLL